VPSVRLGAPSRCAGHCRGDFPAGFDPTASRRADSHARGVVSVMPVRDSVTAKPLSPLKITFIIGYGKLAVTLSRIFRVNTG
jgi:hypothetical protein